jgi:hypothetical protein
VFAINIAHDREQGGESATYFGTNEQGNIAAGQPRYEVLDEEDKPLLGDTSLYVLLAVEKGVEKDQLSETYKYG